MSKELFALTSEIYVFIVSLFFMSSDFKKIQRLCIYQDPLVLGRNQIPVPFYDFSVKLDITGQT